jgi:hypothetical protein
LPNDYASFFGSDICFCASTITFALTDGPSHRSFITIQQSKNQNSKIEISRIINPFSSIFIYKKRGERDRERKKKEREKRDRRNKN